MINRWIMNIWIFGKLWSWQKQQLLNNLNKATCSYARWLLFFPTQRLIFPRGNRSITSFDERELQPSIATFWCVVRVPRWNNQVVVYRYTRENSSRVSRTSTKVQHRSHKGDLWFVSHEKTRQSIVNVWPINLALMNPTVSVVRRMRFVVGHDVDLYSWPLVSFRNKPDGDACAYRGHFINLILGPKYLYLFAHSGLSVFAHSIDR